MAWICPGALTLDLVPEMLREQMLEVLPAPLRPTTGLGLDPADARGPLPASRAPAGRGVRGASRGLDAPPPLTVLASFTWWRGDGALTRIALERALAVDPDYRLARLLSGWSDLAIRPFGVPA